MALGSELTSTWINLMRVPTHTYISSILESSDCKIAIFTLLKFHSLWKILISIINDIISCHSYNFNDTMLLSTLIKRGLKFASLAEKSRVRKKNIFVRGVCASSSYSTQNTVDRATNIQRRVFMLSGFIHTGCFALFIESMSDDDKRASKKKSPRLLSCCLKLNGRSIWMCNWNL